MNQVNFGYTAPNQDWAIPDSKGNQFASKRPPSVASRPHNGPNIHILGPNMAYLQEFFDVLVGQSGSICAENVLKTLLPVSQRNFDPSWP